MFAGKFYHVSHKQIHEKYSINCMNCTNMMLTYTSLYILCFNKEKISLVDILLIMWNEKWNLLYMMHKSKRKLKHENRLRYCIGVYVNTYSIGTFGTRTAYTIRRSRYTCIYIDSLIKQEKVPIQYIEYTRRYCDCLLSIEIIKYLYGSFCLIFYSSFAIWMLNVNVFNVLLLIHYAVAALQLISFFIIVWQMMLVSDNVYTFCTSSIPRRYSHPNIIRGRKTFFSLWFCLCKIDEIESFEWISPKNNKIIKSPNILLLSTLHYAITFVMIVYFIFIFSLFYNVPMVNIQI